MSPKPTAVLCRGQPWHRALMAAPTFTPLLPEQQKSGVPGIRGPWDLGHPWDSGSLGFRAFLSFGVSGIWGIPGIWSPWDLESRGFGVPGIWGIPRKFRVQRWDPRQDCASSCLSRVGILMAQKVRLDSPHPAVEQQPFNKPREESV